MIPRLMALRPPASGLRYNCTRPERHQTEIFISCQDCRRVTIHTYTPMERVLALAEAQAELRRENGFYDDDHDPEGYSRDMNLIASLKQFGVQVRHPSLGAKDTKAPLLQTPEKGCLLAGTMMLGITAAT